MKDLGKKNILGIGVDALDYEAAVTRIMACARARESCAASALAVHGLVTGALDPIHKYRLNAFQLLVPDGQPVRWAMNWLYGTSLTDRVYGPNLMLKVCEQAAKERFPVYFYGSNDAVVRELQERMRQRYPDLHVVGARQSRFRTLTASERDDLVEEIRHSGARVLFVGLGCPRQEVFAYEMAPRLQMPVLAVGAAFDYHAGFLHEPHAFIQASGLQWLYRLLQEPKRLLRRYMVTNTQFVTLFAGQRLGLWRPQMKAAKVPPVEMLYG